MPLTVSEIPAETGLNKDVSPGRITADSISSHIPPNIRSPPEYMNNNSRSIAVNGRELRSHRIARGWTQAEHAKAAGYTERLVSKAENGGSLEIATIQDLAEALSTPDQVVSFASLTLDIAAIARKWVETFARLETRMLCEMESLFTDDFEFVCPGDPQMAPFVGTWKGTNGLQRWLDLFFGFFEKTVNEEVEYMVGDGTVIARWLATCTYQGVQCPPVRINMHFQFENGLIARIVDDYDTHTGSVEVSKAKARVNLQNENLPEVLGE